MTQISATYDKGTVSRYTLHVDWALPDGESYHAGDSFTITFQNKPFYVSELIGRETPMLDSEGHAYGTVKIIDRKTMVAVFSEAVENQTGLKGTIDASFYRQGLKSGEVEPLDVTVNDQPFSAGEIEGHSGDSQFFPLVKGPMGMDRAETRIRWYAELNVNLSAAQTHSFRDMPGKGHRFNKALGFSIREVIFAGTSIGSTVRWLVEGTDYTLKTLADDEGVERGFEVTFTNPDDKQYYIDYYTELIEEELTLDHIDVNENGKPIFRNAGLMNHTTSDGVPKDTTFNFPYVAINFSATIEGQTTEASTDTTSEETSASSQPSTTTTTPQPTTTTTASVTTTPVTTPVTTTPESSTSSSTSETTTTSETSATTASETTTTSETSATTESESTTPTSTATPTTTAAPSTTTTTTTLAPTTTAPSTTPAPATTAGDQNLPRTGTDARANGAVALILLAAAAGTLLLRRQMTRRETRR